jgi:hypothetical protein
MTARLAGLQGRAGLKNRVWRCLLRLAPAVAAALQQGWRWVRPCRGKRNGRITPWALKRAGRCIPGPRRVNGVVFVIGRSGRPVATENFAAAPAVNATIDNGNQLNWRRIGSSPTWSPPLSADACATGGRGAASGVEPLSKQPAEAQGRQRPALRLCRAADFAPRWGEISSRFVSASYFAGRPRRTRSVSSSTDARCRAACSVARSTSSASVSR